MAGVVHAWVGQIVTLFAYSLPSRPLDSPTPTQPKRVTQGFRFNVKLVLNQII